jgi:acyl-CoA synthetase (AMP-forming)/AMP-acid ligase II
MPAPGSDPTEFVRDLINRRAASGRTAFVEGATSRRLGWGDVAARADGWCAAGSSIGVGGAGRARVGLLISDPLEMAAGFLAALAAGVTVAPLNATGATPELVTAAATLGLAAVVGGETDLDAHGPALGRAGLDVWEAGPSGVALVTRRDAAGVTGDGADAAMLLSSSGTTGPPKLIPLRLGQILHTADSVVSHHRLEPADRGYSPLPLSHINGLVVGVLAALVGGHSLVLDRRFSASSFWDVVERNDVTWLNLVPAMISILAARPAPDRCRLGSVAFARSASAPLPVTVLERFQRETGVVVVETYGMTEAGSQVTSNPRPPVPGRSGSVGQAVGVELRVVDGERRSVPAGQVGAVEIRGESVVTEYWAPGGTVPRTREARRPDGWLETGDLGRLDADGYVYLAGRNDDVINRGGEKVYPREVEEVLYAEVGVAAAAVVGRPHAIVGEEPVAFVVPAPGVDGDLLLSRLAERCAGELSRFRRPAEILLVEALPSGPNGKVRRGELRSLVRPPHVPGRRRREVHGLDLHAHAGALSDRAGSDRAGSEEAVDSGRGG